MNITRAILASGVILVSQLPAPAVDAQEERGAIEDEVRRVVNEFWSALRTGDSTTVVRLLHPEARIFEGGHAETIEEYRNGHLRSDIAFAQAVRSETTWDEVFPGETVAVYMSERRASGEYRGREIDSRGAETIVLARTAEGWRLRHIHWSSRR